jgi:putative aldouronate transport system permease protein
MAFQRFKPALGFFKSDWADPWYRYFKQLVTEPYFARVFRNTVVLGLETLLWTFPAPIILAILFNELKHPLFKRVTQTISYMPYFLSTVVVVGLMKILFATHGPVSVMLSQLGTDSWANPFMIPGAFRTMYIGSSIWTGVGYSSIIYLAAIAGTDQELYEAAKVDGANRFQQIVHITFPLILPTVVILLIFSVSGIIGSDTAKILLMYNPAVYETADVIGTYTFRVGIEGSSQAYAAAAGLFTSVLAFILLSITNFVARKVGETSLW